MNEMDHINQCIWALGMATGALRNQDFVEYLRDRGATDAEVEGASRALIRLARAFYRDRDAPPVGDGDAD